MLDHDTYEYAAATIALEKLKELKIPLILNSSKTAAEIASLRQQLNNVAPYVVENGAGIYLNGNGADDELIRFGIDRNDVLAVLNTLRDKYGLPFTGFADLSVAELAEMTGLSEENAEKAKRRDFTEPLCWQGSAEQWALFCTEIEQAGLSIAKGGRFFSISGKVDKGQAVDWLRHYYQQQTTVMPYVLALGDSDNDKQMLESADVAIVVRSGKHALPEINSDNLIITNEVGPVGWNNSVIALLEKLKK